jgi:hypothetical protein
MRHFGNDNDGFTMVDFISLIIILSVFTLIFIGVFLPDYIDRIKILLRYLKVPFWSVLAFYFGAGVVLKAIPFTRLTYKKVKVKLTRKQQ